MNRAGQSELHFIAMQLYLFEFLILFFVFSLYFLFTRTVIQVIINIIWMIISPARAMHHYPTREDNLLVCDSYVDASYMIAFSYPILLIVICTVYAVLTRKIPEAFNESKHIGECEIFPQRLHQLHQQISIAYECTFAK